MQGILWRGIEKKVYAKVLATDYGEDSSLLSERSAGNVWEHVPGIFIAINKEVRYDIKMKVLFEKVKSWSEELEYMKNSSVLPCSYIAPK